MTERVISSTVKRYRAFPTDGPSVSVLEEDALRRQRLLPALWKLDAEQRADFDAQLAAQFDEDVDPHAAARYVLRTSTFAELELLTMILESMTLQKEAAVDG
jgi:hypothetical protein